MPKTVVSSVPSPVYLDHQFYGPPEVAGTKTKRSHYHHQFSETNSLTDAVVYQANFETFSRALVSPRGLEGRVEAIKKIKIEVEEDPNYDDMSEQEINEEAVKRYVDSEIKVIIEKKEFDAVVVRTLAEQKEWLDPVLMVDKYDEAIEEHLRRRVNNYLMQLVTCFGTRLHFEVGPTQDQAESATSLYVEFNRKSTLVGTRNAAHSSTFPCLVAYDSRHWNKYLKGNEKPQGVFFLKRSDVYKATNSTIDFPRCINDADICVDGSMHSSTFSQHALYIINECSNANITLAKGLLSFLKSLEKMIIEKKKEEKRPAVKRALEIYESHMRTIREEFVANSEEWILLQTNLLINMEEASSNLRAKILRVRVEAIHRNMRCQSELMDKIEGVAGKILEELGKKRAPNYFREAFNYLVIQNMGYREDRERITKLFSLANPHRMETRKTGVDGTIAMIKANSNQIRRIQALGKILSCDMRTMRSMEVASRGDSMRALRNGKGWTQDELGWELRQLYPSTASSQPTISNTETGKRVMSLTLAGQLSETFDVPAELLITQFFFE